MRWRHYRMFAVFGLLAAGLAGPTNGAQTTEPSPDNTEVNIAAISNQVDAFARDLERLRRFMGVTKVEALDLGIRDPLLRDLHFQTLTLWEKTDRLLFEVKRAHGTPPAPPSNAISLQDILDRLRNAQQMLREVMQELKIAPVEIPASQAPKSFPELFNGALEANRQLNQLLERHISPSDVFRELTLAIGYSARLLARYPDATRIPPEPAFDPDKQPEDVYRRLAECLQTLSLIFDSLGMPILRIDPGRTDLDRLQPGDVYLVAAMIVSQLDFLHRYLGTAKPPPQPVYPGLKFPAHSYQRAGILQAQLQQLERFVAIERAPSAPPARLQEREIP